MKELNLSEGRATGIPTIQDELRKNGSAPARIETDDERSYFLLEIPCRDGFETKFNPGDYGNEPKVSQKSKPKVSQKVSQKSEPKGQLKTVKIILDLITEDPKITTKKLMIKSGKSRTTVQNCIRILKEEQYIKRDGGNNGGRWILLA